MKVGNIVNGFAISSKGLSIQRKKMNLIAENIANADTVRAESGQPYKRQYLEVSSRKNAFANQLNVEGDKMRLNVTNNSHIANAGSLAAGERGSSDINYEVIEDDQKGEVVFMPNHPDADEQGYVELANVNVITEMVEMIAASRSYEANLTAFNASKQMAKDALEI